MKTTIIANGVNSTNAFVRMGAILGIACICKNIITVTRFNHVRHARK